MEVFKGTGILFLLPLNHISHIPSKDKLSMPSKLRVFINAIYLKHLVKTINAINVSNVIYAATSAEKS